MLKSIIQRLELAEERFNFLEKEISQSEIINNQKIYTSYTKEYSDLKPLVEKHQEYKVILREIVETHKNLLISSQSIIYDELHNE